MVPRSTVVPPKYVPHLINDAVVHATTTSSLGRQTSTFYSPNSMDELQKKNMQVNNSNKDSGSINMMEFLESMLLSDETQTQDQSHHHVNGSSSAMPILMQQPTSLQDNTNNGITTTQQHGSFTLPTNSLFRGTVDHLIQQQHLQINNNCNLPNPTLQPQETYEETMSLEEFLMKSGALEGINQGDDHHDLAPSIQTLAYNNSNMDNALLMQAAAILEVAPPPQINSTSAAAGPTPTCSFDHKPVNNNVVLQQGDDDVDDEGDDENGKEVVEKKRGRKRKGISEGLPMEVVRERRIQRMIKNRESASKSRTRKLTYTHQLEAELAGLRAENSTLKNQVVLVMSQLEQYKENKQKDEVLRKLRRSSSYPTSSFV